MNGFKEKAKSIINKLTFDGEELFDYKGRLLRLLSCGIDVVGNKVYKMVDTSNNALEFSEKELFEIIMEELTF